MFEKLHFHRHESLEKVHKIPSDHVVIDLESYEKIMGLVEEEKKIQEIKKEEEKRFIFPDPFLPLYPNKFKIIRDIKEAEEPGLYYFNDLVPDDVVEPLTRWVSDLLGSKEVIMGGFNRVSITEMNFHKKYGYSLGKLNYKMGVVGSKRAYLYEKRINTLHLGVSTGLELVISLKGTVLKDLDLEGISWMSIEFAGVLMSAFNILFGEGEQRFLDYLTGLKIRRFIYEGKQHHVYTNLVCIQPSRAATQYIVDLDNQEKVKKDFELLKKYLIK